MTAQHEVLYADWCDSAQIAKKAGAYAQAAEHYRRAFSRRRPLAAHAVDAARMHWLIRDTSKTRSFVDEALALGMQGAELERDSVLNTFWKGIAAAASRMLWQKYKAMELPELRAELEAMFREDQEIRMNLDWEKADSPDSLVRRSVWMPVEVQDKRHYDRVVEIIDQQGVPSIHQVGLTGNKMIFFAFIHANSVEEITPWVLKLHESVESGESPGTWYAYVIDRVMIRTTKVTLFGTTGYFDRTEGVTNFKTVDPELTDLMRESMGLPRFGRNAW